MLHLAGQCIGQSGAVAVARYLVVYLRRSGDDPQLSPWLEGRNHIHPVVHRVQDAIGRGSCEIPDVERLGENGRGQ
jgi:transcriptional regulator GlxA family with amidase domain